MVARAGSGGLKEWHFSEESPSKAERTREAFHRPSIGRIETTQNGDVHFKSAATGRTVTIAKTWMGDRTVSAGSPAPLSPVVGADKRFTDLQGLTLEIFRLKRELASGKHDAGTLGALRQQIVMRQSEWVCRAKSAKLPEPTGPLDPLTASPAQIATAFLWSEAGGVTPRSEIERDGGRAFKESVRDAVTLRLLGFDAMLELHAGRPDEQKAILLRSLQQLGATVPPGDPSVDVLRDLRRDTQLARSAASLDREQREAARQLYIGLDGVVGTRETLDAYERGQAIEAANPGTTLGSIFATYLGGGDVERMRALGNAGNAIEAMGGGAGVHLKGVGDAREPVGTQKLGQSDFNAGKARFKTKPMDPHYFTEDIRGNHRWPAEGAGKSGKFDTVRYHNSAEARAPFKLDVRAVDVGGRKQLRIVDAGGKPFDTRGSTNYAGDKRAIFVMNASGDVYASTFQKKASMHHSSLAGGAPVAAAGELVVEDGKLVAITTSSGHYRPTPELTAQFLESLRERGLNFAGVRLYDAATGRTIVLDH